METDFFIEVDYFQEAKFGQVVSGDVFLSKKIKEDNRIIAVLSDGLGSGIKANVLSTLTATMARNYTETFNDICQSAETIMATLPVCNKRKIAYSTFTIVDIHDNHVRVIEYGNPSFLFLTETHRGIELKNAPSEILGEYQGDALRFYDFEVKKEDRLVVFSDGVSQSGMGMTEYPLGWEVDGVGKKLLADLHYSGNLSAAQIARSLVLRAKQNDGYKSKDDTTCGVFYFRDPRKLMVVTGPPSKPKYDAEMVAKVKKFSGKKIVCGGTTAKILSRELNEPINVDLNFIDPNIPPIAHMAGFDLITEGIITLANCHTLLKEDENKNLSADNGSKMLAEHLKNSDIIEFVVGTKINEAHQDPNIPDNLELRRNIIRRIAKVLEEKYMKETRIELI